MPISADALYNHKNVFTFTAYLSNTDPALDAGNGVIDGKWWLKTTNDAVPRGAVIALYYRDNGAWVAVLVPGGGGGLDADTLDGNDSTAFVFATEKGAPSGVATLDAGGKIPSAQIPAIALVDVFTAADETAHLALVAQEGDHVIRTDEGVVYVHNGGTAGTMADYTALSSSTGVTSFNGRTGVVVPVAGDYALADITGLQAALDDKAALALTIEDVAGTSYTFSTADTVNKFKRFTAGTAVAATLPANADDAIPVGRSIPFAQFGAGQITVVAGAGVTVRTAATLKSAAQYSGLEAIKVGTNEWLLTGDLALT